MAKSTTIKGLTAYLKQFKKDAIDYWVKVQTDNLIEYAKAKIVDIADAIQSRGYKMDRTGNLLDSLCWVVSYSGEMKGSGFFRSQTSTRDSYLHERFSSEIYTMFPVYGHALAQDFINRWGTKSNQGEWMVAFGILAPYWGYWEVGHENTLTGQYEKFAIMAEFYDKVTKDLHPAKTRYIRSRPHYSKEKLQKMRERLSNNAYAESEHFKRWFRHKKQ